MQFTFPKYLLFYLLGYYIWAHDKKVNRLGLIILWAIGISWLLYVALDNRMWTEPTSWNCITADVFILITTTAIFVTARQCLFNYHFRSNGLSKQIGSISSCTILIYPFHNTAVGRFRVTFHGSVLLYL